MKKCIYIVCLAVLSLFIGACAHFFGQGAKITYQDSKRVISAGIDTLQVDGATSSKKGFWNF